MFKTTIQIEGMACSMCESHIQDALRRLGSVSKVKASRKKKEACFVSEEALDPKLIQKAIEDSGYEFKGISTKVYEKKKLWFF
ncbi:MULTISPECIES: heavy-metal-associated domain-containing protein [Terrabacteria group]|uniref:heavy-metal-associated domain-containing protein n=1 Tax=Bacillati TaxID=1783272 RepID=UPI00193AB3A6|nr:MULTISPECIES: heavy metal-associated domain-containing protein [Terrabacteria group]MBW9212956.1 heavy-metal-associated domain-containing protein [Trueperella sp. zg.1013]QRG87016.1 heavy-metal-associated domain-containing protein [Bulleidia sp. zg-1006]